MSLGGGNNDASTILVGVGNNERTDLESSRGRMVLARKGSTITFHSHTKVSAVESVKRRARGVVRRWR